MSLVQRTFTLGEKGPRFDCCIFVTTDEKGNEVFWFKAKDIAEFLEYHNPKQAVRTNVHRKWQKSWRELSSTTRGYGIAPSPTPRCYGIAPSPTTRVSGHPCGRDAADTLPTSWHPQTVFVSEPGLYALIMRSKKPEAERFTAWIYEEVLPSLRTTGKYEMCESSTSNSDVKSIDYATKYFELQQQMMPLQLELVRKETQVMEIRKSCDVEIAKKDTELAQKETLIKNCDVELAKKDTQLAQKDCHMLELRQHYERKLAENKLTIQQLVSQANMSLTHLGVNALLAKENIEQNDQLRGALMVAGERIVPELNDRPEKQPYVASYDCKVHEDVNSFRITRNQLAEIEMCDRMKQRYREEAPSKKPRSKRYGWLKHSEKFLQIKCPNPVSLWVKIRNTYPHVFYGLKFVNKIKTEIVFLKEDQLRLKYGEDVRACERNLKRDRRRIEQFKRLGLTGVEDAIERCLTPSVCAKERVTEIITNAIEQIREEFTPKEAARRFENASEYTPEQVVNGIKMYGSNVVNFGPINFYNTWFNGEQPSQQQQQPPQQQPSTRPECEHSLALPALSSSSV